MSITITGDLAGVITSAATAVGILVNVVLQVRQRSLSKANAQLSIENGRKLDENTQATKEGTAAVAAKVDEVHAKVEESIAANGNGKPPS